MQVAEAAQPGQRVAAAAFGAGEARHLDEAPRDQRRHGVMADAEPFDDARRDRDDVFQGAAEFHSSHVVARVQAEGRTAQEILYARGRRRVR